MPDRVGEYYCGSLGYFYKYYTFKSYYLMVNCSFKCRNSRGYWIDRFWVIWVAITPTSIPYYNDVLIHVLQKHFVKFCTTKMR